MYNEKELCEKIIEIYPDIGECGINVNVGYDDKKEVYIVDLTKDEYHFKTYLETEDADICMDGEKCIGLGNQITQLRANIEKIKWSF